MKPPQIVIDTNVIISALRSRHGASAKLVSLIGTGSFDIHLSVSLVLEYEDVLSRQILQLGLTQDDISELINSLCALAHLHKIYYLWRPYLRDNKDEFVLELAVAARCDYIITHNRRDFARTERFGIEVVDPRSFLEQIGENK